MSQIITQQIYDPGPVRQPEASLFFTQRAIPETPWNLGFIRFNVTQLFYLHNGGTTPMQFTGVTYSNMEGIEVSVPDVLLFPITINPGDTQRVEILVSLVGPTTIDGRITLNTDLGASVIYLYGIRAPYLYGTTATITQPHNWVNGYVETLSWATEVLWNYDGSEQRIGLRPLPRKAYQLNLLEDKNKNSLLGTYLSARKTDYFYVPTWHDLGVTTASAVAGDTIVMVDTFGLDYSEDQKVHIVVSNGVTDTYVTRAILAVHIDHVVLVDALGVDVPSGSSIAPMRPYYLEGEVSVAHHTNTITEYQCKMASVYDVEVPRTYVPIVYNGHQVFPSDINFAVEQDQVSHKWTILDNNTGLPEIMKDSIDPVYLNTMSVRTMNVEESGIFLSFLHDTRGRAIPFYLLNKSSGLYAAQGVVSGDNELVIKYCQYTTDSENELGKAHIQITYTDETISRHRIIGSEFNPVLPDIETLTVTPAFTKTAATPEIESIKYLQLVRCNTDSFTINWDVTGAFTCVFQIKVLT